MNNILVRPLITEKITKAGDKLNQYGFEVTQASNKIEVKKAVEAAYGVKVLNVNILRVAAKQKVRMTKKGYIVGRKPGYKKAIVTVKEGESINYYNEV